MALLAESDLADQAELLQKLAAIHAEMDEPDKAVESYLAAAELWDELKAPQFGYQASTQAARLQEDLGNNEAAQAIYRNLLNAIDSDEEPDRAATLWAAVGRTARAQEDFAASNEAYGEAVALWQATDATEKVAEALAFMGLNHADLDDSDAALAAYEEAVALAVDAGNDDYAAAVTLAAADLQRDLGDVGAALDRL